MSSSTGSSRKNQGPTIGGQIAVAKVTLAIHRMSGEAGRCAACGGECPCDEANNAANMLATYGFPVVMDNHRRRFRNLGRWERR
jgi:hypothetical protein